MVRHVAATKSVFVAFFWGEVGVQQERVICFVDGFNLYHALKDLKEPHLKWLDLLTLCNRFVRPKSQVIKQVLFFSAYPTWRPDSHKRHLDYVKALQASGVTTVMGHFKKKNRNCLKCDARWESHEEKETDVNLCLALLDLAYKDSYDHAYVFTRDSDMAPAIHKVKQNFPGKQVSVFATENYRHSSELVQASDHHKTIKKKHIQTSLFPDKVYDAGGNLVVKRPAQYKPS